jgi:hypothetical protein
VCSQGAFDFPRDHFQLKANFYRTRKKALGPFERRLWGLEEGAHDALAESCHNKFEYLFRNLAIVDTAVWVRRFVKPVMVRKVIPGAGIAKVEHAPDDPDVGG